MKCVAMTLFAGFCALPMVVGQAPAPKNSKLTEARDAFFKQARVVHLRIEIDKAGIDSLRQKPREYVKARVKDGDKEYTDVAIHLRGSVGSFRSIDEKPGLTLNMDKFNPGQSYRGLDKLHLANSAQDPSYLSELICGELMRAAGVPAARISHAVVTLNERKLGMFYLKEGYDAEFLRKHFGNTDGNFYDGGFLREIDQPLELIRGKKDVADRADLKALIEAAREPDRVKRFQRLEKLLDINDFISYMVLEAIMWDWDGYPFKANNYRIYHNPKTGKLTFIPSGMDQMFSDVNGPIIPDFGGQVAKAVIETPEGRKRYIARAKEIMKTAFKSQTLVKRLDELEKLIQPEIFLYDQGAGRDYKNQVNRLRDAIRQREKNVNEQLRRLTK